MMEKKNANSASIDRYPERHATNKTIGNYILDHTLGKGTFGKVKLGLHIPTQEKVAIKILEKEKIIDKEDSERVLREMKCLKSLNHPNIIKVYEILENEHYFFIVMEYASGGELFHHICKNKRLAESECSLFFFQIINGIEFMHKNNIVHRDLKPENLLIADNNIIKIIDFGLSNYFFEGQQLSTPCGSPCYAAPEMIQGKTYSGMKIDIWSSGIILFAMICGFLPFEDKLNANLFKKIIECKVNFPHFVSSPLRDLINKILVPNPNDRIQVEEIKAHRIYHQGKSHFFKENKIYDDSCMIIPAIEKSSKEKTIKQIEKEYKISSNELSSILHLHSYPLYEILFRRNLKTAKVNNEEDTKDKDNVKGKDKTKENETELKMTTISEGVKPQSLLFSTKGVSSNLASLTESLHNHADAFLTHSLAGKVKKIKKNFKSNDYRADKRYRSLSPTTKSKLDGTLPQPQIRENRELLIEKHQLHISNKNVLSKLPRSSYCSPQKKRTILTYRNKAINHRTIENQTEDFTASHLEIKSNTSAKGTQSKVGSTRDISLHLGIDAKKAKNSCNTSLSAKTEKTDKISMILLNQISKKLEKSKLLTNRIKKNEESKEFPQNARNTINASHVKSYSKNQLSSSKEKLSQVSRIANQDYTKHLRRYSQMNQFIQSFHFPSNANSKLPSRSGSALISPKKQYNQKSKIASKLNISKQYDSTSNEGKKANKIITKEKIKTTAKGYESFSKEGNILIDVKGIGKFKNLIFNRASHHVPHKSYMPCNNYLDIFSSNSVTLSEAKAGKNLNLNLNQNPNQAITIDAKTNREMLSVRKDNSKPKSKALIKNKYSTNPSSAQATVNTPKSEIFVNNQNRSSRIASQDKKKEEFIKGYFEKMKTGGK